MSKLMMSVAGLAMAVVVTGCGGSPSGVAEDFADAVIQREADDAMDLTYQAAVGVNAATFKGIKEKIEQIGKDINDTKLEATVYSEEIIVPGEGSGYKIVNGEKVTGDTAEVVIQYVKGKDKKSEGLEVNLMKVNDKWRVVGFSTTGGLDTTSK